MGKVIIPKGIAAPGFSTLYIPRTNLLRSNEALHFTGALLKNESEEENIPGLVASRIKIAKVVLHSKQNLNYRLSFFGKDTFTSNELEVDSFVGAVELDLPRYGLGGYTRYEYNHYGVAWNPVYLNRRKGQTFTPQVDQTIKAVKLSLYKVGSPADLSISLMATNAAGFPTGSALASGDLSASVIGTDQKRVVYLVELTSKADLKKDVVYCIECNSPGGTLTTNNILWELFTTTSSYARGKAIYATGAVWADYLTPQDQYFEVLGGPVQFYMDLIGLNLPYVDEDNTKELHLALKNLSPTSKIAGVHGQVIADVEYAPMT